VWETLTNYWHYITAVFAIIDLVFLLPFIAWILSLKKESTSAIAWSLLVILLPLFGALLFVLFGYQNVNRPLKRKRQHRLRFRAKPATMPTEAATLSDAPVPGYEGLGQLAARLGATWPVGGNSVEFFSEGRTAFDSIFAAIDAAKHHIHMQFFIFRTDILGTKVLERLTAKAKAGVEVRLLVDGIGARNIGHGETRALLEAGGKVASFLPVSLWRRRFQVNLRNHRKIVVTDGKVAFTGGLNVGDEYLGENPRFGPWRDTFLRLEGPAVEGLQGVFIEDWDFASGESLQEPEYYSPLENVGDVNAQVISSGPDMEFRAIREMYFAAMLKARKRLWITSPYYVPDQGIRDVLCLAALSGVDVRLLLPKTPDHLMPYFAGRYYLPDLLTCGVKVYRFTRGFIHSKVVLADGQWASVGTANLDNRSLLLNFEVNCLFHTPRVVSELERQFLLDLEDAFLVEQKEFSRRTWPGKLAENVCRLFAPVL
jgi:cardiolipin synthase A/B